MIINTKKAVDCFKDIIELPIWGTALYFKMREYMDVISANIAECRNIRKIRDKIKKETKKWPKSSEYIKFELAKIGKKLWVAVLPEKKDIKPSEIFTEELIDFIVERSTPGIIQKYNNLFFPGLKGKIIDIWFEKIQDDYIQGIIKGIELPEENFYQNIDIIQDQAVNKLKNIDFDEINDIFRLIFESSDFRSQISREYRKVWKGIHKKYLKQG